MHWLVRHRSADKVQRLRRSLSLLRRRLAAHPGMGELLERRRGKAVRVIAVGGRLPYLVWYYYDEADPRAPIWLIAFQHEQRDRERFDPTLLE